MYDNLNDVIILMFYYIQSVFQEQCFINYRHKYTDKMSDKINEIVSREHCSGQVD